MRHDKRLAASGAGSDLWLWIEAYVGLGLWAEFGVELEVGVGLGLRLGWKLEMPSFSHIKLCIQVIRCSSKNDKGNRISNYLYDN